MSKIRGYAGDREVEFLQVTNKTRTPGARLRDADACWLSWNASGATRRVQSDCDHWETVALGDPITIVHVDGDVYLERGGIYASGGNFAVDIVLLVAELAGALACTIALVRNRSRRRSARSAG